MSARVVVLTEDPTGPSARHRWAYNAPYLRRAGMEPEILPLEPKSARAAAFAAAREADLIVIHRKLFRLFDFLRVVRNARKRDIRIVYDLDDAVMFRVPSRRRQWSVMRRLRFARTVRQSVLYIAGNRYLWSQGPRKMPTLVQPTPVDVDRYAPKTEIPDRGRIVGWIGTELNLPYLEHVAPALSELAARRGDLVLRVIGPEPPEMPGVTVVHVPWSEAGEAAALRELDVGLSPLTDDPWSRGKCAFKALQYMAAGVPVIASPVGMNADAVADGVTGYHATSVREWTSYLDRLLSGPALRESMGRAGRRRVERLYDVSVLGPRLARNLKAYLR